MRSGVGSSAPGTLSEISQMVTAFCSEVLDPVVTLRAGSNR